MKSGIALLAAVLVAACSEAPTATRVAKPSPSSNGPSLDVIAGTQLVSNGSFENPQIPSTNTYPWLTFTSTGQGLPSWTVLSSTVDIQSGEPGSPFTNVPNGSQVLDLNNASISQTVATTSGVTYRVVFSLSENYAVLHGGTVNVTVSFGGTTKSYTFTGGAGESASNMRWDAYSFDVTATGSSATLQITAGAGSNGSGGPMLDNVQIQSPSTYTSGANVTAYDPLPGGADANWPTDVCTTQPAVTVDDPRWTNPHAAYVLGGHPWAGSYFTAPWINAWNSLGDGGLASQYPSVGFVPYYDHPWNPPAYFNWTKYTTTISGQGNYVIQLLADNCSWIYLDGHLVGVQNTDLSKNTYPVTLNGSETLTFLIFDGGGLAGGKFLLQTYQSYVAAGGDPSVIQAPPVVNSAPTVAAQNATVTVNEGSTATNGGTVSDPDNDAVTLTASVGTVTNNGNGTWSWSFATTDGPSQSQTVTVTGDDGHGHTATTNFALTVKNVAPSVSTSAGGTIESGDSFSLSGSFTDPGADAPYTSSIDWGDGSNATSGTSGSHMYLVPGTYAVKLTVTDKDGGVGSASVSVKVIEKAVGIDIKPGSDVNPINLGSGGLTPVAVYSTSTFDASTIVPSTVKFGPAGIGTGAHHAHFDDVNDDGRVDYLGQFDTDALGLTASSTSACLTGVTTAGVYIKGCDHLTVVPPKGKSK